MTETEIADAYRNRFEAARSQADRLEQVYLEGGRRFPALEEWLFVALAPSVPGTMRIGHRSRGIFRTWAEKFRGQSLGEGPFIGSRNFINIGTGRINVSNGVKHDTGAPTGAYAELHTDGSGFVATPMITMNPKVNELNDETLVLGVSGMLNLLSSHSVVNCGSHGDAVVKATIGLQGTERQWSLGHWRGPSGGNRWVPWPDTSVLRSVPPSRHTIALEAVATENLERAQATRMIVADWLQAFGVPEVLQISENGALRTKYWTKNCLEAWKGRSGLVETTEEVSDD